MQSTPARRRFHQQNVAVSTHEQVGLFEGELGQDAFRVFRGASTDVRHPNLRPSRGEPRVLRPLCPNGLPVDVAKHRAHGRHFLEGIGDLEAADVPRMPNFIASFHMLENAVVHVAMGV